MLANVFKACNRPMVLVEAEPIGEDRIRLGCGQWASSPKFLK